MVSTNFSFPEQLRQLEADAHSVEVIIFKETLTFSTCFVPGPEQGTRYFHTYHLI